MTALPLDRSGWLLTDTEVVTHGFRRGHADARVAVLEAGTAVLIDQQGVPRVKCKNGNPLRAAGPTLERGVFFPDGDRSFADRVVAFVQGPGVDAECSNPINALGAPNYFSESRTGFVSLGTASSTCEYSLTLEFEDNRLIDAPGNDLRVFEIGLTERTDLLISTDGRNWRSVGQIEGGTVEVDIGDVALPGDRFRYVKLCDAPDLELSDIPGADIDAVGAIHSVTP